MEREGVGLDELPEGCLANVLSWTGPGEVGRISLVSSAFRSAALWDSVWERFLPPDYPSLLSQSSDPSLLTRSPSKKHLFLSLSLSPLLIDSGKKSFSLDKWSGKKCYMLSARDLMIVWSDTPRYWRWVSAPESRFTEVAELISVCWLEICGKINTSMLSPNTMYKAYLVFKTTTAPYGFEHRSVDASVGLVGSESSKRAVYLDAERGQRGTVPRLPGGFFNRAYTNRLIETAPPPPPIRERGEGESPKKRGDGWWEIELGQFYNQGGGENGELEIRLSEVNAGDWKGGLIVEGIELRPHSAN